MVTSDGTGGSSTSIRIFRLLGAGTCHRSPAEKKPPRGDFFPSGATAGMALALVCEAATIRRHPSNRRPPKDCGKADCKCLLPGLTDALSS